MVTHHIAKDYQDALAKLSEGTYRILAGGTDLMVRNRRLSETPVPFRENVLYIHGLDELRYVREEEGRLAIGALTSYEDLLHDERIPAVLRDCLLILASPAIRKMGTIAGNIGNASPAGDTLVVLRLLDAECVLESADSTRTLPYKEIVTGPGKVSIRKEEIIKEIRLPLRPFDKTVFWKVGGRKADAISKVAFAGAVRFSRDKVADFRLSFGAVAPKTLRAEEIEADLKGKEKAELKAATEEIVAAYAPLIRPISDQRSNAAYRKEVALNMIRQFIASL